MSNHYRHDGSTVSRKVTIRVSTPVLIKSIYEQLVVNVLSWLNLLSLTQRLPINF